jgi:hypothetical protein
MRRHDEAEEAIPGDGDGRRRNTAPRILARRLAAEIAAAALNGDLALQALSDLRVDGLVLVGTLDRPRPGVISGTGPP